MREIKYGFLITNKWIFLSAFCLVSLQALSQNPEKSSLRSFLGALEDQHNLIFSYADETIDSIYLAHPSGNFSLDQWLSYLQDQTGLIFEKLDDTTVIIRREDQEITTVCRILIDSETSEPVIAAALQWPGGGFTTSDNRGKMSVDVTDSLIVTVNHISYQPKVFTITADNGNLCDTLYLNPRSAELPELLVSNYLIHGVDKKTTGELILKPSELQVLPGLSEPDVLYTVQVMPGIQSTNESVSNLSIRGGTHDQNLILWNGIKMYQSGHFFGLISAFNPYTVRQVLFTKNGTSAALGEAVSGTIDIRSGYEALQDISGSAGINMLSADFNVAVPITSNWSVEIAGRRSLSGILPTPTYNSYYDRAFRNPEVRASNPIDSLISNNEKFDFYDISFFSKYHISKNENITLSFLHIQNDLEFEESLDTAGSTESRKSRLSQTSTGLGLSHEKFWTAKIKSDISLSLSTYELNSVNNDLANDQILTQINEVDELGLNSSLSIILGSGLDLKTGINFQELGIRNFDEINQPAFRRDLKDISRALNYYGELYFTSPSQLSLARAGLRANHYLTLNRLILEPRLAISHKLSKEISLELLGEFKNQVTAQIIDAERDFLGVEKRRWILANDHDLPIIQGKQISLGIHGNYDKSVVSLELYLKTVSDIISSSQNFQNQFEFIRAIGAYNVQGLDFLVTRKLNTFSTWLAYSLAYNEYDFPDLLSTRFPNNLDLQHILNVGTSCVYNAFEFSGSVGWHSGRPYTDIASNVPVGGRISYSSPNSSRIENYLRLDLSAKYRFNYTAKLKGMAGISVWNLTSNENVLNTYFRVNDRNQIGRIQLFGLDFTPNAVVRVQF